MKDEKSKITAVAIEKMIDFYQGNLRDIEHFLKVWAYAKTIGEQESVDENTQGILELAAVVHDISCPLCREKYGNTNGKNQELESEPLVKEFFEEMPVSEQKVERIIWLVTHHHTYTNNRIVSDDTKEERDLTERFQKIDAAIVESNAKTENLYLWKI